MRKGGWRRLEKAWKNRIAPTLIDAERAEPHPESRPGRISLVTRRKSATNSPLISAPDRTPEGLVQSETWGTTYFNTSANTAIRGTREPSQQYIDMQPFIAIFMGNEGLLLQHCRMGKVQDCLNKLSFIYRPAAFFRRLTRQQIRYPQPQLIIRHAPIHVRHANSKM